MLKNHLSNSFPKNQAIIDQLGWESKTYGPLIHDLEYNLRFVYVPFGLFDAFVRWCNKSRSDRMIGMYEKDKKYH